MSRWLKSVNNLLEALDENVGEAVENKNGDDFYYDEYGNISGVGGESSVDDILAKRGLLDNEEEEDEEEEEKVEEEEVEEEEEQIEEGNNEESLQSSIGAKSSVEPSPTSSTVNVNKDEMNISVAIPSDKKNDPSMDESGDVSSQGQSRDGEEEEDAAENSERNENVESQTGDEEEADEVESNKEVQDESLDVESKSTVMAASIERMPERSVDVSKSKQADLEKLETALERQKQLALKSEQEAKAASKEARKLRRNVVKLNTELDSAERELEAQRTELDRAAVRIEKDRQRYKEEKERFERERKEEIEGVSSEHKAQMEALAASHAEQVADMEKRIQIADEARAKEGGDMTLELAEAAARERETLKRVMSLEDEKSTLTAQISSLQTQMAALESRLESSNEAAESASEREREADDRLDSALSLHARQISQRQARESELERTIADLGAALVVSRQRESNRMNKEAKFEEMTSNTNDGVVELKEKLMTTEDELETVKAQIILERQRSETLQQELKDVVQERTQEMSSNHAKQKQNDRQISDLTSTVAQLQSTLRSFKRSESTNAGKASESTQLSDQRREISTLTEELIRQRTKFENSSTEILTLRNRLRAALTRAENAEKAVKSPSHFGMRDIERGNPYQSKRRGKITVPSIRNAIKFDPGRGETKEQLGRIIDVVDNWAVDLGSFFRTNALARGGFLLYFIGIHLWIAILVIFHTSHGGSLDHSYHDIHGPDQLVKQSYRHMEQVHEKP